uniref:SNF-related serine/threonine-protein kinase n=1 Tax=Gouania willdenowi TaxID=441366 RepID=A0A8C5D6W6_GOUWI
MREHSFSLTPAGTVFSRGHRATGGRSDLSGLYQLGRTLGRGHYAVVKLARHVDTGQLVAVKIIDKTKLDVMASSHLLQEVRCMRRVQHPNVVRLHEVIDTPTTLYLVMELADGGDLYDYILRHDGGVAEGTAKRHFTQIARAVAYCHQLHVVHRDLKPENVVFFPQQGAVKLTDFGFSNLFQPGTMLATSCGSLAYSAPEILLGEEYDAPAVDIWSLGVILYMLVCGVPPFQETNDSETLVMILDCRYSVPNHVSDDCRDLISQMLQKDPSCRASLEQIEAHKWLHGLDSALLTPEAPPHWLSGALSPCSTRSGAPECGDLLAYIVEFKFNT